MKVPELRRFRTNTTAAKITLCSWWDLSPRSPDTGEPFEQSQLAETLIDRPTAADAVLFFFARCAVPEGYSLWASNRVLLPTLDEPLHTISGVFSQRKPLTAKDLWGRVLRSHVISSESENLLSSSEVVGFLENRQADLQQVLESFLRRKCEWDFEDTPPLNELLIEDLTHEGNDAA
ncbi:MAG: hypothetical protein ACRDTG_24235 [Pseudonocardiaceae bacterium]